jgi:transcription initiation factor TFIIIB Brf1 subunit/transcription initiation factor TFIIB
VRSLRAVLLLLFTLTSTLTRIAVWYTALRVKLWVNYHYNLLRLQRELRRRGVPRELREHVVKLYKEYYKNSLLGLSIKALVASRRAARTT